MAAIEELEPAEEEEEQNGECSIWRMFHPPTSHSGFFFRLPSSLDRGAWRRDELDGAILSLLTRYSAPLSQHS